MRSDYMKEGVSRAPHRSLLKALGVTDGEMKRPFVAVVSSKSDFIPGHMHLDKIIVTRGRTIPALRLTHGQNNAPVFNFLIAAAAHTAELSPCPFKNMNIFSII